MLAYITKLGLVLFSSLYEWIAGGVNHPRFTNSSWFRTFAPMALFGLLMASGMLTTRLLEQMEKVDTLEKQIQELKYKSLAPSEEHAKSSVLLATCSANLKAAEQRYVDLDSNFKLLQQEVITLRERLIKEPEPVKPVVPEKRKNDTLIESSNRRLKRLGDKKDDSVQ